MEQQTWIGRSLNGRYRIDELLGQGGMSSVYKAFDPNLKRAVAIKLIHPHLLADEDFIYRFKREASAVAAFRHPNIVQVYDFNNDGEVHYMVLEFVPGETLQDRLKHLKKSDRKMPFDQAARTIINVCDALGYAHRQGMIHRDIKPANIMLDTHGQAILMDFGIVKILDATSHTSTGAVMGTARYMSPEVIRSEAADERSDIYSLGVAFYEMLSGDPPFDADSAMSLLMRHLNDPVPDLNSKREDIPSELVRIVNKALEKDRKDRYQNAEEMINDLKRFLSTFETAPVATVVPAPKTNTAPVETQQQKTPASPPPTQVNAQAAPQTLKTEPPPVAKPVPQKTQSSAFRVGAVLFLVIILGLMGTGVLILRRLQRNSALTANRTATALADAEMTQAANTLESSRLTQAAILPTDVPTDTAIPSTPTPTTPYVLITGIHIESNKYVVDYEVHNFPEAPSLHVHMFFDTVPPENAGMPASGPWKLTWGRYGDPPFTQYGPTDRPRDAIQMCSLVANANHTVNQGTGNCFLLPEN